MLSKIYPNLFFIFLLVLLDLPHLLLIILVLYFILLYLRLIIYVSAFCKTSLSKIRDIRRIRDCLDYNIVPFITTSSRTCITGFWMNKIHSQLDYCESIFFNLPTHLNLIDVSLCSMLLLVLSPEHRNSSHSCYCHDRVPPWRCWLRNQLVKVSYSLFIVYNVNASG